MKKPGKKVWILAGCAAAAAAAIIYSLWPESVEVERVEAGEVRQSIREVGHIEADEAVTVYAPVAGRISDVLVKKDDTVKEGDALASYDLLQAEQDLAVALANAQYHEDGYDAALSQDKKNQNKLRTATREADALKNLYVHTWEGIDTINIDQTAKNQYIQSTMQQIEKTLADMNVEFELRAGELEASRSGATEVDLQLAGVRGQIDGLNEKIAASEERTKTYQEILDGMDEDDSEYQTYVDLVQKESETQADLKTERDSLSAQKSALSDKSNEWNDKASSADSSLNAIKNRMSESRRELANLPVNAMTPEEYTRFADLTRYLDIVEREWNARLEQKTLAEEKVLEPSALKQFEDAAAMANAEKEKAETALERTKEGVTAEFDGVITERYADAGAYVEPGTPLFVIQPLTGYKASVMVSRFDAGSVEKGQKAEISVGDETWPGVVERIAPIAEADDSGKPKVRVEIALDDKDASPTIGLEAEITIFTGESEAARSISESAVYTDDDGDYVYVLTNGIVEKKTVVTGLAGNGRVEIEEGIAEGDQVITSPMTDDNIGERFSAGQ